jgi:hypothetical protein
MIYQKENQSAENLHVRALLRKVAKKRQKWEGKERNKMAKVERVIRVPAIKIIQRDQAVNKEKLRQLIKSHLRVRAPEATPLKKEILEALSLQMYPLEIPHRVSLVVITEVLVGASSHLGQNLTHHLVPVKYLNQGALLLILIIKTRGLLLMAEIVKLTRKVKVKIIVVYK